MQHGLKVDFEKRYWLTKTNIKKRKKISSDFMFSNQMTYFYFMINQLIQWRTRFQSNYSKTSHLITHGETTFWWVRLFVRVCKRGLGVRIPQSQKH